MGLFRLLLYIAILCAAIWLWRRYFNAPRRPRARHTDAAKPMVRCAHCYVHIPQEKAVAQGEHWYCSQLHLSRGPGTGGH